MPTTLGPKYSVNWRGRPPHMLRVDVPIWYRFLEKNKDKFISIYYDCLLGGPAYTPTEEEERYRKMWKYLGSKRADVIAETKDKIWIIEVTNEVKIKAIGQLVLYKSLWFQDPKNPKPVEMVLVCDFVDSTVVAIMEDCGIRVFVEKGGGEQQNNPADPKPETAPQPLRPARRQKGANHAGVSRA